MSRSLRIGFVSARAVRREGDRLLANAGLGRLLNALQQTHGRLTVALSLTDRPDASLTEEMLIEPGDFFPLPAMPRLQSGFLRFAGCREAIRSVEKRSDLLIVQLPFASPIALCAPGKPRLYHLCADISVQGSVYRGIRRPPATAAARFIDALQKHLCRHEKARVVTNGEALLQRYGPRGRSVVSATIRADEIASVTRTRPADAPFRVLFAGFMRHEKGLDVLLDAFRKISDRLASAELQIVGAEDATASALTPPVLRQLDELDRRGVLIQTPHLDFGPELFQVFADADVLALPSRTEGTPRVLVEARAFGCPVVASSVGGVPSSIDDGVDGLLFQCGDDDELARKVLLVAGDDELRARLIAAGLARARQSTLEEFAAQISAELEILAHATGTSQHGQR